MFGWDEVPSHDPDWPNWWVGCDRNLSGKEEVLRGGADRGSNRTV